MLVVLFGEELSNEQIKMLEEIASLLDSKFYDKYDEKEGRFYDATPINIWERTEVYVEFQEGLKLMSTSQLERRKKTKKRRISRRVETGPLRLS